MFTYQNKTALVTGASSGIGASFAKMLAARGANLVLVARSEAKMQDLADTLQRQHQIKVTVLPTDLSKSGAATQLYEALQKLGITVNILVNNAGFSTYGNFVTVGLERQHEEIMLNVGAVVELTHTFLPQIREAGNGAIINVASIAGFQPVPYMAVYGATKAFLLSFTEALWMEEKKSKSGVRVLALCPGATDTNIFEVMGTTTPAVGSLSSPERVVEIALLGLEQRRSFIIPGIRNYWQSQLGRVLPRSRVLQIAERMLRPKPTAKPNLFAPKAN
jgi:short-subunit dehydrogenase